MTALQATSHDNRGDHETTFGFVYFNDDTRILYTGREGAHPGVTGGWAPITSAHVEAADRYLNEHDLLRPHQPAVTRD